MREQRSISLPDPPHIPTPAEAGFYTRKVIDKEGIYRVEERRRDGNILIITVTKRTEYLTEGLGVTTMEVTREMRVPAVVTFEFLKRCVTVEPDEDAGPPWQECDGYEHEVQTLSDWEDYDRRGRDRDNFKRTRGYFWDNGVLSRVIMTDESYAGESEAGRINYLRKIGASKQVARERIASENRHYIDQIVEWRSKGWEYWWTKVEVTIAGKDYEASCGGIDDSDYATGEMANELASEIAGKLEDDGFTVTGSPYEKKKPGGYCESYYASYKWNLKRKLNMFNWD